MKTHCFGTIRLMALGLLAGSCSANIHDNNTTVNIPNATINATVSADVDVNNVMPSQQVPVNIVVNDKIFLVDPNTTPPAEHVADAGHVQVYMDDTNSEPILITAQAMFNVTIPAQTKAGNHKLICRFHKHDKTPTDTKSEISIVVKVSGTVGDASVTVEIDASTTTTSGTGGAAAGTGGASGTGGATAVGGAGGV